MIDFTGRFGLKNYMLGKFTKWGIKAKQIADRVDKKIVNGREEIKYLDCSLFSSFKINMRGEDLEEQTYEYYNVICS
jgi:hypothetical protein